MWYLNSMQRKTMMMIELDSFLLDRVIYIGGAFAIAFLLTSIYFYIVRTAWKKLSFEVPPAENNDLISSRQHRSKSFSTPVTYMVPYPVAATPVFQTVSRPYVSFQPLFDRPLPYFETRYQPSKGEQATLEAFSRIFPDFEFYKCRPSILLYENNEPLELDVYCHELGLAGEYQGPHHYTDSNQQTRDTFKRQKCTEYHIILIEIPNHLMTLGAIELFLLNQLRQHRRFQPLL